MGLFKILQAAAVHNNKSAGEREERQEGEEEGAEGIGWEGAGEVVRNILGGFLGKTDCQKMAGGEGLLKMPPGVRVGERECSRGAEQS